ncbi:histone chaperone [Pelagophyceae sp. CCMP2097]|nr:histone chaperone [Pelagophyceae sp. CCMP2097]
MALVDLIDVKFVAANPARFDEPFEFEITFECLDQLEEDLEWKITYVGSAEDPTKDQMLEEVMVGPVPLGTSRFVLQSDAPDPGKIPDGDVLGVTVVSITCAYKDQPFVNVGYYVANEYYATGSPAEGALPTELAEIPRPIDMSKVYRNVCADQPRVTRYGIKWVQMATPELPPDGAPAADGDDGGGDGDAMMDDDADEADMADDAEEGDREEGDDETDDEEDDAVDADEIDLDEDDDVDEAEDEPRPADPN